MRSRKDMTEQEKALLDNLGDLTRLEMITYCCLITDPYDTFTLEDIHTMLAGEYPIIILHDTLKRLTQLGITLKCRSRKGSFHEWKQGWCAANKEEREVVINDTFG